MNKIIKYFFICCCCFSLNVYASSCTTVMDENSNRVLYAENENTEFLIASTTKIMTAIVTINNIDINKKIKVEDEVLDAYGSAIYINPGEILRIKDLLFGLMLRSGNDAALTLAKNVGGSTLGFVKLMNETANALGMKNTKFYNPHGLDEETQNKSTCYDMALLLSYAMKNKTFRDITKTKEYNVKTNFNTYKWHNKNKLLSTYKYAIGGKIGYTKKAGHTFVSVASKNDKTIVISTFRDEDMFNNHKYLYEKYFKLYKNYKLIDKDNLKVSYDNNYLTYTTSSYNTLLKKDELKKIIKEVVIYKNLNKDIDPLIVGKIKLKLDSKLLCEKNIYAKKIKEPRNGLKEKIKNFLKG